MRCHNFSLLTRKVFQKAQEIEMREPLQVEMGLLRDQFQIFNACDPVFFAIIKEVRTIKRRKSSFGEGSFLYYISLCCALLDAHDPKAAKREGA